VTAIFFAFGGAGRPEIAPHLIVGFGFGASFVALFAQLGGGIYTKAADMGADLVGKVEAGIPEDDPRNAAVIADLVGDNVGDCAGRGADLFESTAAENIGAMILGVVIYMVTHNVAWILFPLVVRAFGMIASMVGLISVRAKENENAMNALNRGYYVAVFLLQNPRRPLLNSHPGATSPDGRLGKFVTSFIFPVPAMSGSPNPLDRMGLAQIEEHFP